MTSPAADTKTDSALDMAMEQRSAKGSRRSIRFGRLEVEERALRIGVMGGIPLLGRVVVLVLVGTGTGLARLSISISTPLPLVGGADSARLFRMVVMVVEYLFLSQYTKARNDMSAASRTVLNGILYGTSSPFADYTTIYIYIN
jgi:hypothetical protein